MLFSDCQLDALAFFTSSGSGRDRCYDVVPFRLPQARQRGVAEGSKSKRASRQKVCPDRPLAKIAPGRTKLIWVGCVPGGHQDRQKPCIRLTLRAGGEGFAVSTEILVPFWYKSPKPEA